MRGGWGRIAEHAAYQIRRDVVRDWNDGKHAVGADFAPVERDPERGGRATAIEVCSTVAEQSERRVAASFAFCPRT